MNLKQMKGDRLNDIRANIICTIIIAERATWVFMFCTINGEQTIFCIYSSPTLGNPSGETISIVDFVTWLCVWRTQDKHPDGLYIAYQTVINWNLPSLESHIETVIYGYKILPSLCWVLIPWVHNSPAVRTGLPAWIWVDVVVVSPDWSSWVDPGPCFV